MATNKDIADIFSRLEIANLKTELINVLKSNFPHNNAFRDDLTNLAAAPQAVTEQLVLLWKNRWTPSLSLEQVMTNNMTYMTSSTVSNSLRHIKIADFTCIKNGAMYPLWISQDSVTGTVSCVYLREPRDVLEYSQPFHKSLDFLKLAVLQHPSTSAVNISGTLKNMIAEGERLGFMNQHYIQAWKWLSKEYLPNSYPTIQQLNDPDKIFEVLANLVSTEEETSKVRSGLMNVRRHPSDAIYLPIRTVQSLYTTLLQIRYPNQSVEQIRDLTEHAAILSSVCLVNSTMKRYVLAYIDREKAKLNFRKISLQNLLNFIESTERDVLECKLTTTLSLPASLSKLDQTNLTLESSIFNLPESSSVKTVHRKSDNRSTSPYYRRRSRSGGRRQDFRRHSSRSRSKDRFQQRRRSRNRSRENYQQSRRRSHDRRRSRSSSYGRNDIKYIERRTKNSTPRRENSYERREQRSSSRGRRYTNRSESRGKRWESDRKRSYSRGRNNSRSRDRRSSSRDQRRSRSNSRDNRTEKPLPCGKCNGDHASKDCRRYPGYQKKKCPSSRCANLNLYHDVCKESKSNDLRKTESVDQEEEIQNGEEPARVNVTRVIGEAEQENGSETIIFNRGTALGSNTVSYDDNE